MEGKSAVCRFCSALAWSGMDILLYGMITERLDYARGRAQKYHRWRGEDGEGEGEESSEWRGTPMRPDSGERAIEDFLHA